MPALRLLSPLKGRHPVDVVAKSTLACAAARTGMQIAGLDLDAFVAGTLRLPIFADLADHPPEIDFSSPISGAPCRSTGHCYEVVVNDPKRPIVAINLRIGLGADRTDIMGCLWHELVHAKLGVGTGHTREFRQNLRTVATQAFPTQNVVAAIGDLRGLDYRALENIIGQAIRRELGDPAGAAFLLWRST